MKIEDRYGSVFVYDYAENFVSEPGIKSHMLTEKVQREIVQFLIKRNPKLLEVI